MKIFYKECKFTQFFVGGGDGVGEGSVARG